jgi:hypothetical protein
MKILKYVYPNISFPTLMFIIQHNRALIIVIITTILHVYIVCYIRIAIWGNIVRAADAERGTTQLVTMHAFLSGDIWT